MLAKYPQYQESIAKSGPAPKKPEARTVGNYAKEGITAVGRGVRNDVMGAVDVARQGNIFKTVDDLGEQAQDAWDAGKKEFQDTKGAPLGQRLGAATLTGLENAPMIGGMVRHAEEGGESMASPEAFGSAVEGITTFAAPEAAARAIKLAPRLVEPGTRATKELVKDTRKANVATAEGNRVAGEKHLQDTLDAVHETRGRQLKYEQDVRAAQDAAGEAQKKLDSEHSDKVRDALEENRQKEDVYRAELKRAKEESEEAYQKKLEEVNRKRSADESGHREDLRKYLDKKAKVQAEHDQAIAKFEKQKRAQEKIGPTQQALRTAWSNLRAGVETARENALKEGNRRYSGVNKALSGVEVPSSTLLGNLLDASEKIQGSMTSLPILKDIEKAVKENDSVPYSDLQGYYSELGRELSKGTLPGDVFHTYDTLHEAIGDQMQKVADSKGMGKQLTDARNYWRRMKQTFGKPFAANDAASGVLKGPSGLSSEDALLNEVRLLGSFDPGIPGQFAHVKNIERGLKALPDAVPARQLTQQLAEAKAKPLPLAPRRGGTPTAPEPVTPRYVKPPDRTPIPDRPPAVQAKMPDPYERVAPPDRPKENAPKKIGAEDIREAKGASLEKKADRIRSLGDYGAVWPAFYSLRTLIHGGVPNLLEAGAEATAIPALGHGIANILEKPAVKDFLTRATARDVAQIPEDLRGDMSAVVKAAQKKGIKVSPLLVRSVQGTAFLAPRKEQNATDSWAAQQR